MSRILISCVLTLTWISPMSGDQQSAIIGRVTDSEGASISNSRVLLHWDPSGSTVAIKDNIGTTQDVSVVTNASGDYSASVPAGIYDLFVSSPALTPVAAKVRVNQGRQTTFSVKLSVDPLVSNELGGMEVSAPER